MVHHSHWRAAVSAFAVAAALVSVACSDDEKSAYVGANEALVRQIPVFPNAVEVQRSVLAYYDQDGFSRPEGYITFLQFRVPDDATAEEVSAYFSAFDLPVGWSRSVNLPFVYLCSGRAVVRIETLRAELSGDRDYEIFADRQERPFDRPTCP